MVLLAVTSDTWIVTGLGFGIVLGLLFCLIFILQFFGWVMQKITAPKAEQPPKAQTNTDDVAAIAMALHLFRRQPKQNDNNSMITFDKRETAWNPKSNGFNNVGF